jgi:thiamine-monophosphate kinase
MDTSDGLISTLDQLMRLNEVGFELTEDFDKIIDEASLNFAEKLNIPSWLLFAGQHGEFELIFTIPKALNEAFLEEASLTGFEPIELGEIIPEEEIRINLYEKLIPINSKFIRNLLFETKGDVNHYLKLLLEYDSELKKSPNLNFTTI